MGDLDFDIKLDFDLSKCDSSILEMQAQRAFEDFISTSSSIDIGGSSSSSSTPPPSFSSSMLFSPLTTLVNNPTSDTLSLATCSTQFTGFSPAMSTSALLGDELLSLLSSPSGPNSSDSITTTPTSASASASASVSTFTSMTMASESSASATNDFFPPISKSNRDHLLLLPSASNRHDSSLFPSFPASPSDDLGFSDMMLVSSPHQYQYQQQHQHKHQQQQSAIDLSGRTTAPACAPDGGSVRSPSVASNSAITLPPPISPPLLGQPQPSVLLSRHMSPSLPVTIPDVCPIQLITINEGFALQPGVKQPGGKDNTKRLPKQVIELNLNVRPNLLSEIQLSNLRVRASLLGYDRSVKSKQVLDDLGESRFKEVPPGIALAGMVGKSQQLSSSPSPFITSSQQRCFVAEFEKLIVKRTSHNNGGKLFVRFSLLDFTNTTAPQVLAWVDSAEFETITKRGMEKKRERERSTNIPIETIIKAEAVDPCVGVTYGKQFVKVIGQGFMVTPLAQLVIKFGNNSANEIFTVKRNFILCETPAGEEGIVDVSVSFDGGKSYIDSDAQYKYVNPESPEGAQLLLMLGFRGNPTINLSASQFSQNPSSTCMRPGDATNFSSSSYQGATDIAFFLDGGKTECGFNLLSITAARGLFELTAALLEKDLVSPELLNDPDNYGRTPLFWALWGGHERVAAYMIRKGAHLNHIDEIGDNVLHVAIKEQRYSVVTKLLGWLRHNDDYFHSNAERVLELIDGENEAGFTPLELAELSGGDGQFINMLRQTRDACVSLVQQHVFSLREIRLRIGAHGGKALSSECVPSSFCMKIRPQRFEISFELSPSSDHVRAFIEHSNIAFLAVVAPQSRVEFTLFNPPKIELQVSGTDEWVKDAVHEDYLSSCLSLHIEADPDRLESVHSHLRACADLPGCDLLSFQPYCFGARRPTPDTDADNTASNSSLDQAKLSHNKTESQQSPHQTTTTSPRSKHHVHELLQRSVAAARGVKALASSSDEQLHQPPQQSSVK